MISYRFRRRTFLTGLGGAVGLKVMLRNMEVSAQTAKSPPRLLVTKWPLGIIPGQGEALWKPTTGAVGGHALQTFADNGLADDMISIRGISTNGIPLNGGGGTEGGTVVVVTGVACAGTRANRGEPDDGIAGGPSVDQILLRNAPGLRSPTGGPGYANSIGDLRTDLGELSTKVLSYSNDKQAVPLYNGELGTENVPLMPTLSPLEQYNNLFSTFVPTAALGASATQAAPPVADGMLTQLASKRSVLDFVLAEIAHLKGMVPGEARQKLQNHYDAVEGLEKQLTTAINTQYPVVTGTGGNAGGGAGGSGGASGSGGAAGSGGAGGSGVANPACRIKPTAPPNIQGQPDWTTGGHGQYGNPKNYTTDDTVTHQTVGRLHMEVLRAAFVCDLIRSGTFNWAPATGHVAFQGLHPTDQFGIYGHSAMHHTISNGGSANQGTTPDSITNAGIRFLFNVQVWYFARQAENVKLWKESVDGFGNPLLDYTVIPFVTESATYVHDRGNMAAMLFGGKKLGLAVGQYKSGNFPVNNLWGTVARAMGYDPTAAPDYNPSSSALREPIPGLWSKPPDG